MTFCFIQKLQSIVAFLILFTSVVMNSSTESLSVYDESTHLQKQARSESNICNERTCESTCVSTTYPCLNFPKCKKNYFR